MTKRRTNEEFISEIADRDLTPLEPYKTNGVRILFRCNVDGHTWRATPASILKGHGCPKCGAKKSGLSHRKGNQVLQRHDTYLDIDVSTPAYPNAVMQIDCEDWERIQPTLLWRVYAFRKGKKLYAHTKKHNEDGKQINLPVHKLILQEAEKEIDHISDVNGGLDNRKINLRAVTHAQNLLNRGRQINNTSGVAGVGWTKSIQRWVARITKNKKQVHLGCFKNKREAAQVRKYAELIYYGEFAYAGGSE